MSASERKIWIVAEAAKRLGAKIPGKEREFVAHRVRDEMSGNKARALREMKTAFYRVQRFASDLKRKFAGVEVVDRPSIRAAEARMAGATRELKCSDRRTIGPGATTRAGS